MIVEDLEKCGYCSLVDYERSDEEGSYCLIKKKRMTNDAICDVSTKDLRNFVVNRVNERNNKLKGEKENGK